MLISVLEYVKMFFYKEKDLPANYIAWIFIYILYIN